MLIFPKVSDGFFVSVIIVFSQRDLVSFVTKSNPRYSKIVKDVFTG